MNFGNIVIMMSKLAQSQETLRSGVKDIKTIFDFENLLAAWGFYQETDGYKDLVKNPVEGFVAFKDDMDKIKVVYNEK